MIKARMRLREHVIMTLPAADLKGHFRHAANGDAVAAGSEGKQLLLLAHRHVAQNLPEPPAMFINILMFY